MRQQIKFKRHTKKIKMKKTFLLLSICFLNYYLQAQEKPVTDKVVEAAEKTNKKSQQISEASNKVKEQAQQVGTNAQNIASNVKAVIKIFEPILQHFKKKKKPVPTGNDAVVINTSQVKSENSNNTNTSPAAEGNNSTPQPANNNYEASPADTAPPHFNYGVSESPAYNTDGTANWGNQYNAEFGCYLDAFSGTILDGGSAEDKPNSVDLIFLAPNDGQNAYYIITPNLAHDNVSADAFWGSATTDNPVKSWKEVNESEVALTTLTGAQFEKIQYNENLRGAVKQAKGFASFYISLNKLDGKVFAVKSTMANRDAYALIYVVKHVGTSGSGGYLKVKIKCTGFDNNGDGNPDVSEYNR